MSNINQNLQKKQNSQQTNSPYINSEGNTFYDSNNSQIQPQNSSNQQQQSNPSQQAQSTKNLVVYDPKTGQQSQSTKNIVVYNPKTSKQPQSTTNLVVYDPKNDKQPQSTRNLVVYDPKTDNTPKQYQDFLSYPKTDQIQSDQSYQQQQKALQQQYPRPTPGQSKNKIQNKNNSLSRYPPDFFNVDDELRQLQEEVKAEEAQKNFALPAAPTPPKAQLISEGQVKPNGSQVLNSASTLQQSNSKKQQNKKLQNSPKQQQQQIKQNLQQKQNFLANAKQKQQPNFKQKILYQFQTLNNKQIVDIILVYVIKIFSLIFFYVSQYYVYQLFVQRIVQAKASADPLPDLSIYIRNSIIGLTILQIIPLIIILTMVSRNQSLSPNSQATIIKIVGDVFLTNFILYFFGKTFVSIILSKSNNNYQDQPSYAIQELSSLLKYSFLYIVLLPYFSVFYLLNSLTNQPAILASPTPK